MSIAAMLRKIMLVSLALACGFATGADRWPCFRGDGSGITSATNLPEHWSPQQGIAWRADIPGYGQSSPVVWNDMVYVTSSNGPFQESCQVHAFRLSDGARLWSHEIKATHAVENYFRNSRAAPTCAVDKHAVYSFFASGDVTALTHDGEVIWSVPLIERYGDVDNERGIASSLAQTEDFVLVVVDHHGPSYLVAIEKKTGDIAWKSDRGRRVPSWSSPVIARHHDRELVIISSSDTVDAYDAGDGRLLWQIDGLQGNHIPSATVLGDRIFVGSTNMFHLDADPEAVAGSNCCIQLTTTDGQPSYRVRWGAERANSYYSSPLAHAGYVYYVNKSGVLYCVDDETGEQRFAQRIGNPCWASAIGSQNKEGEPRVYFVLKNGFTVVIRPGDEFDQIARNQLWSRDEMVEAAEAATTQRKQNAVPTDQQKPKSGPEKVFANMPDSQLHQMFSYGDPTVYGVAAVDGHLIVRTGQRLYCVRSRASE